MNQDEKQALKSWILENPNLQKYIEDGTDNLIAASLNNPNVPKIGELPMSDILFWLAKFAIKPRLKNVANLISSSDPKQQQIAIVADAALDLISSPHVQNLNIGDNDLQQMLEALVAADVIPEAAYSALLISATTMISQAQILIGRNATDLDVAECLRGE